VHQTDASVAADELFYACANQVDPLLPQCGDPGEDQPAWGYLGPYCLVTLRGKGLLHVGSDVTLFFDGGQFAFADYGAHERFRNAPLVFVNLLPLVPPPRILVLGTRGSGKTSIATEIGRMHNAPVYEFPANLQFVPATEEEPDPEEVTRRTLEPFFRRVLAETDSQRRGWIIEGTRSVRS
jgi:hypothetical protein